MKKYKMIFSPTGGTAAVADAITAKWTDVETVDLADSEAPHDIALEEDALALIAMPSFGGLAPRLALERLAKIKADGTKCAIVAVYGNRAYEDTLMQMKDCAEQAGCRVIAAVAAVAEHSIIRAYAAGRPNADDREQLCGFGERILSRAAEEPTDISVPGNRPYKASGAKLTPKASSACTSCGECAKLCPAGAIPTARPRATDKSRCIGCMRCVSICPAHARGINPIVAKLAAFMLKRSCSVPKANELYI